MSKPFKSLTADDYDYLLATSLRENNIQYQLREKTIREVEHSGMMSTPDQMQFVALLIRLMQAKRVIEVGVFTGYGTLSMAQALPQDGLLIACDKSEQWPSIGIPFWEQAQVADKISLRMAPALETLQTLLDTGEQESFDFIFIDADKINYLKYYKLALELIRSGGLIIFDNTVYVGEQAVMECNVPATKAIYELNQLLLHDERVDISILPVAQGMTLVFKL